MVGVPGKYKGCETCRLRRVKCDNTRPLCKKCRDTGRECAGYERKPVFIIGTPEDGGRCSSHPPRVIKSRKASGSSSAGGSGSNNSSRLTTPTMTATAIPATTNTDEGSTAGRRHSAGKQRAGSVRSSASRSDTAAASPATTPAQALATASFFASSSLPSSAASSSSLSSPTFFAQDLAQQQQLPPPRPQPSPPQPPPPPFHSDVSEVFAEAPSFAATGFYSPPPPTPAVYSPPAPDVAVTDESLLSYDPYLHALLATAAGTAASASSSSSSSYLPAAPTAPVRRRMLNLVPALPLRPAWDDAIALTATSNDDDNGAVCTMQFVALVTHLPAVGRQRDGRSDPHASTFALVPLPAYAPADVRPDRRPPAAAAAPAFGLAAQCLVHLSGGDGDATPSQGVCLFLYEHTTHDVPPWGDPSLHGDGGSRIRQAGPGHYTAFPAHHFFARVYRPTAIWSALINRQPTFLSDPAWTTVPWEAHPKSWLDQLLDLLVLMPPLLARAEEVLLLPLPLGPGPGYGYSHGYGHDYGHGYGHGYEHRHGPEHDAPHSLAQDLLGHCLLMEQALKQWRNRMEAEEGVGPMADGEDEDENEDEGAGSGSTTRASTSRGAAAGKGKAQMSSSGEGMTTPAAAQTTPVPLARPRLVFRDAPAALVSVFYWAALVLLRPCIDQLQGWHGHHPSSSSPSQNYGNNTAVRRMAARVCRSLDAALPATAQPDLLTAPLHVVETFYRAQQQTTSASDDGTLEVLWCEMFRRQLVARGQYISNTVQTRRWVDAAQF